MVQVYTNHIGYDSADTKNAVYRLRGDETPISFRVINEQNDEVVFMGTPVESGEVDNWQKGYFYTLRFDEVTELGRYYIEVEADNGDIARSYPFRIGERLLEADTISAATYFFKSMRCTGEYEFADKKLGISHKGLIDEGPYDLHGGWKDATGDPGVHISHLNDTTYFNPQQVSFSAYVFFKIHDLLEESDYPYYTQLKRYILEEGMYGAEFILRSQTKSGGFFVTISHMNALEPVGETRVVRAYPKKVIERMGGRAIFDESDMDETCYEASLRAGGGYCIAALAAAARCSYPSVFKKEQYLEAAIKALNHYMENNDKYTNDGKWNLIDEYCLLDGLVELYKTTREYGYLVRARKMAERVMGHYIEVEDNMGYISVDETDRPFYHACDAGMPVVNLINYYEIEPDKALKEKTLDICEKVMRYQIAITDEVTNPFGYARQFIQNREGERRKSFFYPHDCESWGWWQGESARQGSLAAAARAVIWKSEDEELKKDLMKFADDQINWILGLNPYDSCMFQGRGRNSITYFYIGNRYDFFEIPGGISNGITSGINDEHGIEFVLEPREDINDNWRWAEQWLPHNSWYLYAMCYKKR